jgi:hypothetical protein
MPPDEYDLAVTVEFVRGTDRLAVGLPASGTQAVVQLSVKGEGGYASRLDLVDGKAGTATTGRVFETGRPHELRFRVRRGGLTASVDGRGIVTWKGDWKQLTLPPEVKVPNPRALFLCAWSGQFRVTRMEVAPVLVGVEPQG